MRPFAIVLSVALAMLPARAVAQPPVTTAPTTEQFQLPEPGDILPLHRGQAAPQDGLLIDAGDLLGIQQGYERMRFLLGLTQTRDTEICDVRVQVEHARTTAAEDRLTLRDGLWTARQTELLATIQQAQQQAQHAAERGFFEQPAVWFAIGILVATIAFIAVSVR
jgi:hypothetical protein